MPDYVYRGVKHDLNEPWPDDRCGSYAGYKRHLRNKETPCEDCRAANRTYNRNQYAKAAA